MFLLPIVEYNGVYIIVKVYIICVARDEAAAIGKYILHMALNKDKYHIVPCWKQRLCQKYVTSKELTVSTFTA